VCEREGQRERVQASERVRESKRKAGGGGGGRDSSDEQSFFLFSPHNHIINIKKMFSFSGIVKDCVIFPFYFLLHKLHKPMPPPLALSPTTHPPIPAERFKLICRRRRCISLKCVQYHPPTTRQRRQTNTPKAY
jgi:hypothetical protein